MHTSLLFSLILVILAAALRPLRNIWFVAHIILCGLSLWGLSLLDLIPSTISPRHITVHTTLILIIIHLFFINIITFTIYAWDKHSARANKWRIPEKTLHAFAFIGGTPAAFIARKYLRHKTIKGTFIRNLWIVIFLQILVIASLFILVSLPQ